MIKLFFENFAMNFQMFSDSTFLNLIIDVLIFYMSYPYGWNMVDKLYKWRIINGKELGSHTHWLFRAGSFVILFWIIKIPLVLCVYVHNKIISGLLLDAVFYFVICATRYSYCEHKKNSSWNRYKRIRT